MAEYSYEDVIIDPNDPRVEIGETYYFALGAQACIDYANRGVRERTLKRIDESLYNPFIGDEKDYPFIIRKKEPVKRYVPFDLNEWEQAMMLGACWLINKDHRSYHCITAIYPDENLIYVEGYGDMSPEELLEWFIFAHDNTPCGKLVKEE